MKYDPHRTLSLRVPRELRARLEELSARRGVTRHALAVDALTAGVEQLASTPASVDAPSLRPAFGGP